jgi:hypothetical protein
MLYSNSVSAIIVHDNKKSTFKTISLNLKLELVSAACYILLSKLSNVWLQYKGTVSIKV